MFPKNRSRWVHFKITDKIVCGSLTGLLNVIRGQLCKTEATLQNKNKSVALSILRERLGVKIRTYKEIVGFRKF